MLEAKPSMTTIIHYSERDAIIGKGPFCTTFITVVIAGVLAIVPTAVYTIHPV